MYFLLEVQIRNARIMKMRCTTSSAEVDVFAPAMGMTVTMKMIVTITTAQFQPAA
jgi:hypothetical protein